MSYIYVYQNRVKESDNQLLVLNVLWYLKFIVFMAMSVDICLCIFVFVCMGAMYGYEQRNSNPFCCDTKEIFKTMICTLKFFKVH